MDSAANEAPLVCVGDERIALRVLDRRLAAASSAPIGVAFSGGGDSLMALKTTRDWARRHARSVIAFHVDHRLQDAGAAWAQLARESADRLGVRFVGLSWDDDKPSTGVPAAARQARHKLIAEAARRAGVRVVVFGHTADDRIEAGLMRDAGLRIGDLREWSPSPVWPEGHGVFCLRPLLEARRATIRDLLTVQGESWIDDPMNQDPRSPRARARPAALTAVSLPQSGDDIDLARLADQTKVGLGGEISLDRAALRTAAPGAARRLVGAACVCAGGQGGPGRSDRLEALTARLVGPGDVAATLSGAKIIASDTVRIVRDAGEVLRGGLAQLSLAPGETGIWDGRFEIRAGAAPATVTRLAGQTGALDREQRRRLKALPASVRPGLPLMVRNDAAPTCPIFAEVSGVEVSLLVAARFAAACGVISKEPAT